MTLKTRVINANSILIIVAIGNYQYRVIRMRQSLRSFQLMTTLILRVIMCLRETSSRRNVQNTHDAGIMSRRGKAIFIKVKFLQISL